MDQPVEQIPALPFEPVGAGLARLYEVAASRSGTRTVLKPPP